MKSNIPENLNPHTLKKFEAIGSYDPYENIISELNNSFHHNYNQLVHKIHNELGQTDSPVIVLENNDVNLLWNGQREEICYIPDLYHKIKAIGHVSFGVYLAIKNNGAGKLKEDIKADLANQKTQIVEAIMILDKEEMPDHYREVQFNILENARMAIENVISTGRISENFAGSFAQKNGSLYLESTIVCVAIELDVLNDIVLGWKSKMSQQQWDSLFVVICSGHQARYRLTTVQYFDRLLGEEEGAGASKEDKVVYGENIHGVDSAMDMLSRHIIDQTTSLDLFGNKTKMQEDLMADAAEAYLDKMFGQQLF